MKEVTQYECGHCGTLYDDADTCKECEEYHIPVKQVIKYAYYPKDTGPEAKYPYAVSVVMNDGKNLIFTR